jgi:hypothetical protein
LKADNTTSLSPYQFFLQPERAILRNLLVRGKIVELPGPSTWWERYPADHAGIYENLPDRELADEAWQLIFGVSGTPETFSRLQDGDCDLAMTPGAGRNEEGDEIVVEDDLESWKGLGDDEVINIDMKDESNEDEGSLDEFVVDEMDLEDSLEESDGEAGSDRKAESDEDIDGNISGV